MIDKKYKNIVAIILFLSGLAYAVFEIHSISNIFEDNLNEQLKDREKECDNVLYGSVCDTSKIQLSKELQAVYKLLNVVLILFIVGLIYGNIGKNDKRKKNN